MYGTIAVYIKYCPVCLKIDYTLICLEYICSVSSPSRWHNDGSSEYTLDYATLLKTHHHAVKPVFTHHTLK